MGYGCAGIKPDPLDIVTQKPVPDIRGEVVWILCGEGNPRRYGICARFVVTGIEKGPDGKTSVAGKGTLLKREIPLNDEPWFKQFLSDYQNFSLGFREIKERVYIDELERLMAPARKDGPSTPKEQPTERPKQTTARKTTVSEPRAERSGASPTKDEPLNIFIACSPKDQASLDEIETNLKAISWTEKISYWHTGMIAPGSDRQAEIKQNLSRARVILLLISSDFMASDDCRDISLEAMRRRSEGEVTVVPIIVRKCAWTKTPLAQIQALPADGRPVDDWPTKDAAFENIAMGIHKLITKLRGESPL